MHFIGLLGPMSRHCKITHILDHLTCWLQDLLGDEFAPWNLLAIRLIAKKPFKIPRNICLINNAWRDIKLIFRFISEIANFFGH